MSKKGYRQKPSLYVVTDTKKGWRNRLGRPTAFNLEPIAAPGFGPSRFDVTLPLGCHDAPIHQAMHSYSEMPLVLVVPGVGVWQFGAVPESVTTTSHPPQVRAEMVMNIGTYRFRAARKRKPPQKAQA